MKNAQSNNELLSDEKKEELINELEKYRLIIENTGDPVLMTTLDGIITYMNYGAIQIFGDIRNKQIREVYFSDDISSGYEKAHEVMHRLKQSPNGTITDYETVFIGKDGIPVPVSASFSLFKNINREIVGTIGIVKDLRKTKDLIQVGNTLLSLRNIDEILEKISETCLELPKAIRAYIKLYDETTNRLLLRALKTKILKEKFPVENTEIDKGITGFVFKTQKPYLAYEPSKRFSGLFKDVKSKIVVPINRIDYITGQIKTFGVINVDSREKNAFSVNDMYFLTTLANQAAAAIENANLITSKTKIIIELSALEKVLVKITRTLDIDQILESVLDVVIDILGFDYATISKVNFSTGMIGAVKGRNIPKEFLTLYHHSLESNDIQAWVARNKKDVKILGYDERLDREIYERFHHEELIRIYLPILSRDEAFGTLETGYHKTHRQDISNEEIDTLKKVVNLAGIGIDQAYLLKEQQNLVDQLQALNQASVYIQSSKTEVEAVEHIFRSLERIGYTKGMLSLVNETTGNIEGRYALGKNWKKIVYETKRDLNGNDILAVAIREKRSIISKDSPSDPACDPSAIKKSQVKSQCVIPLFMNEIPIGTLQIDLSDKLGLINGPEEILIRRMHVLETFASQIAIAIRNITDMRTIHFLETSLAETAHEFRSPLHNIMTNIGALKDYLEYKYGDEEKEIENILTSISEDAHRAKRQMENTLLLSNIAKKLIGFNFEEGYIQEIIENCVKFYRNRALQRGINIVIKDNVKKLPKFRFDKQKIDQLITNFIDNAIKYSLYGEMIQISGYDDGTKVNIEIWDKGLGIPETEYINIFKGFTRGQRKDKTKYIPGTGLGLKISKEIVEGHGGKIKVKSTPFTNESHKIHQYDGYDTIFTIVLPKRPKEK